MHFRKFKQDLKISRFDFHSLSSIDSLISDLMYLFSPVLIRKILRQVFFDEVLSIVMILAEVIEGEWFL